MRVRGWTPNSLIIRIYLYKLRIIKTSPIHILRCASLRTSFEGGDITVNIHEYHNLEMVIINEFMFPYKFSKTEEYQK